MLYKLCVYKGLLNDLTVYFVYLLHQKQSFNIVSYIFYNGLNVVQNRNLQFVLAPSKNLYGRFWLKFFRFTIVIFVA